ncbi:MAG: cation-transporting P-type ATPase [Candidatus Uhrbacteria bacterium]|nr:cation-transporting P-type ATPase [Candidatus Uhrbacteria bacterium]
MQKEAHGLTDREAAKRLRRYGPNSLRPHHGGAFVVFARQFASPFVVLLLIAACVTVTLHQKIDTLLILGFVVVNGVLGFIQEYRSERALRALSTLSVNMARVIRSGHERDVPADQIVLGDLLVLREGDVIPADVRFVEADNVQIDESMLTGESVPIHKSAGNGHDDIGFSQTSLASGVAHAVVTATGIHSRIGAIDTLALSTHHHSMFDKQLGLFGRATLRMVVVALVIMAAARVVLFPGEPVADLLIFAVALAVSVIPEALPLVTTFALSTGALRLAKRHVIVKRLTAIEDLGSIDVLCCDKTGTLTRNRMQCHEVYGDERLVLATSAFDCSSLVRGFDGATWRKLTKAMQRDAKRAVRIHEEPFDATKRYSASLVRLDKQKIAVIRGAPESVARHCNMERRERESLLAWASEQGTRGRRVLAVARGPSMGDCRVIGAVSYVDPLKPGVGAVIKKARALGITIKILSGDSAEVTGAIATQAGIIDDPAHVVVGDEIEGMSKLALRKFVRSAEVFARVSPEQKHRIIQALEEHSAVGFLGEGVNDAPALRAAHVGIVVREASDIARASADIILVEPDLDAIIEGVLEGRKIFANTVKYVRATITSNFGNFFAIIAASFFIPFLPMTAVQLLLVNLLSDFPMMTIVTDTVDDEDVARPHGEGFKRIIGAGTVLGLVSTAFDLAFFFIFVGAGATVLQTNWFIGSILTELVLLFSIRTARPFLLASRPSRVLVVVSLIAAVMTVALPFTPWAAALHFIPPTIRDVAIIGLLVVGYVVTSEVAKAAYLAYARRRTAGSKIGWV